MPTTSSVFVDTSGWAEPLMGNSADHEQMERYYRALIASKRQVVTTNYILSELVALLTVRSRFTRPELLAIIKGIKRITHLNLVHIDPEMDAAAWALLEQYNDKAWSVVDAASFVVMRRMSLTEAFTSDHHFTQAGFVCVPTE